MKENNNELSKNAAEQVAGGVQPDPVGDINNQLAELRRLLENERKALRSAEKRLDTSPGADETVKIAKANILELQGLIYQREQEMADLLADIEDLL